MPAYTVNELLVMKRSLQERRNQLKELVRKSAVETRTTYGDHLQEERAKYDVVHVDKRVTEIEMALYKIDGAVKRSNAVTQVEIPVQFEHLMGALEKPQG